MRCTLHRTEMDQSREIDHLLPETDATENDATGNSLRSNMHRRILFGVECMQYWALFWPRPSCSKANRTFMGRMCPYGYTMMFILSMNTESGNQHFPIRGTRTAFFHVLQNCTCRYMFYATITNGTCIIYDAKFNTPLAPNQHWNVQLVGRAPRWVDSDQVFPRLSRCMLNNSCGRMRNLTPVGE